MNDTELDRLLSTWESPAPPKSMRDRLRARFPRAERRGFARPLKWGLIALCSLGLTFAIAQTGNAHGDAVMHIVDHVYGVVVYTVDMHRAAFLRNDIRQSQPKVYVDEQLAGPLEYRGGATLAVRMPGDGVYVVSTVRYLDRFAGKGQGWVESGRIHGNLIEFEAGGHQVRIECNRSIFDGERPVLVVHLAE